MITKIALENFKGIGKATSIRLAPLTLLFGANSAGKSTVLHALAYARDIFERHNCDATKTMLGGDSLDLGGFMEIVHGHNENGIIRMKFDFSFTQRRLMKANRLNYIPERGWVKIEIGIPKAHKKFQDICGYPCVLFTQVGIDEKPLVELEYCFNDAVKKGHQVRVRRLNIDHPAIEDEREAYESLFPFHEQLAFREGESDEDKLSNNDPNLDTFDYHYLRGTHALPEVSRFRPNLLLNGYQLKRQGGYQPTPGTLNMLISRSVTELLSLLTNTVYVGPIRQIPERNFVLERITSNPHAEKSQRDVARWANGLGAYDVLPNLAKNWGQINDDLSKEGDEYLETGYELVYIPDDCEIKTDGKLPVTKKSHATVAIFGIEFWTDGKIVSQKANYFPPEFIKYVKELSPEQLEQFKRIFPRGEWFGLFDIKRKVLVQMHNVGVGLSQIIPLVVCMAKNRGQALMFEQPELHLHPKQQAAVGDLLIRAAMTHKTQIIAETHSIHLIQRILRRIREHHANSQTALFDFKPERDLCVMLAQWSEDTGTQFRQMKVRPDGKFQRSWPDSFFDQELYEKMEGQRGESETFKKTDEAIKVRLQALMETE